MDYSWSVMYNQCILVMPGGQVISCHNYGEAPGTFRWQRTFLWNCKAVLKGCFKGSTGGMSHLSWPSERPRKKHAISGTCACTNLKPNSWSPSTQASLTESWAKGGAATINSEWRSLNLPSMICSGSRWRVKRPNWWGLWLRQWQI